MRLLFAATLLTAVAAISSAEDKKGTPVELAGMKSTTPGDWIEEAPSNKMRFMQFKITKAEGDPADAELALFKTPGGGSVQDNLTRQEKKFEIPAGKKAEDLIKTEKMKVGAHEAIYQDIKGTYLKKSAPFDPNAKATREADYRQLYVIFEHKEGDVTTLYSMYLIGPAKTVEKHKKDFDEWVKNFK
jgi:hypothetical protein